MKVRNEKSIEMICLKSTPKKLNSIIFHKQIKTGILMLKLVYYSIKKSQKIQVTNTMIKNTLINMDRRQKGIVSLVVLAFFFASMGIFARYMHTSFTLFQQIYLRVAAAFLLTIIFFHNKIDVKKIFRIPKKDWLIIIVRSLSMYVLGVSLFTYGIVNAKYSNVSFISALPLTSVLGFLLLKEKFTLEKAFYVLMAFVGVVVISVTVFTNLTSWGKGELTTLISVVFFSISYIARKWQSKILNNYEITTIIFLISMTVVFLISIFSGEAIPVQEWNLWLLGVVIGAGLFNVGNLLLTNYGFERVEAVLAGNILTLESLFAVVVGFIFFRELPIVREFLGGILILANVIKMNKLK